MSASATVTLECDGIHCPAMFYSTNDDTRQARQDARAEASWDYDAESDEDFCDNCKEG